MSIWVKFNLTSQNVDKYMYLKKHAGGMNESKMHIDTITYAFNFLRFPLANNY